METFIATQRDYNGVVNLQHSLARFTLDIMFSEILTYNIFNGI